MSLIFNVVDGPRKGRQFKVFPGMTLGRRKADINLDDLKVSNLHAKIEEHRGKLIIIDNNSRNGLYCGGEKVPEVELTHGAKFRIGYSVIEVLEVEACDVPGGTGKTTSDTWQGRLRQLNSKVLPSLSHFKLEKLFPLSPVVQLQFTSGKQLNTLWTLGYGPRSIGRDSFEMPVYDKAAPKICFQIVPSDEGPVFKTDFPDRVKLNDRATASEKLKEGDTISFGKNTIRVKFIDV